MVLGTDPAEGENTHICSLVHHPSSGAQPTLRTQTAAVLSAEGHLVPGAVLNFTGTNQVTVSLPLRGQLSLVYLGRRDGRERWAVPGNPELPV